MDAERLDIGCRKGAGHNRGSATRVGGWTGHSADLELRHRAADGRGVRAGDGQTDAALRRRGALHRSRTARVVAALQAVAACAGQHRRTHGPRRTARNAEGAARRARTGREVRIGDAGEPTPARASTGGGAGVRVSPTRWQDSKRGKGCCACVQEVGGRTGAQQRKDKQRPGAPGGIPGADSRVLRPGLHCQCAVRRIPPAFRRFGIRERLGTLDGHGPVKNFSNRLQGASERGCSRTWSVGPDPEGWLPVEK